MKKTKIFSWESKMQKKNRNEVCFHSFLLLCFFLPLEHTHTQNYYINSNPHKNTV